MSFTIMDFTIRLLLVVYNSLRNAFAYFTTDYCIIHCRRVEQVEKELNG